MENPFCELCILEDQQAMTVLVVAYQHLNDKNKKWPDVSHFGYRVCSTLKEAKELETSEIENLQPKYNKSG